MMEVKVFHSDMHHVMSVNKKLGLRLLVAPQKDDVEAALRLGSYMPVATVSVDADTPEAALEQAFAKTQNLDGSWCQAPGVLSNANEARSSMVGDMFEVNGRRYVVATVGFVPLSEWWPNEKALGVPGPFMFHG